MRHQVQCLPREPAAAQVTGKDHHELGASIDSLGALLMRQQPLTAILKYVAAYAADAILVRMVLV